MALSQFPPSLWYFDLKHSKTLPFRATAFGLGKVLVFWDGPAIARVPD
ncbi:hypothetical protein [Laspinema olomoucense]|nr:hypothetical protein [Laspinema sp. D3a]MCT7986888.1 hypothetical protein [Laspinema sp. D3a]